MNRLLGYVAAVISLVVAVFTMGRKTGADSVRADAEQQARDLEAEAHAVDQQGADKEQRIRDEIRNNPVRDIDLD